MAAAKGRQRWGEAARAASYSAGSAGVTKVRTCPPPPQPYAGEVFHSRPSLRLRDRDGSDALGDRDALRVEGAQGGVDGEFPLRPVEIVLWERRMAPRVTGPRQARHRNKPVHTLPYLRQPAHRVIHPPRGDRHQHRAAAAAAAARGGGERQAQVSGGVGGVRGGGEVVDQRAEPVELRGDGEGPVPDPAPCDRRGADQIRALKSRDGPCGSPPPDSLLVCATPNVRFGYESRGGGGGRLPAQHLLPPQPGHLGVGRVEEDGSGAQCARIIGDVEEAAVIDGGPEIVAQLLWHSVCRSQVAFVD